MIDRAALRAATYYKDGRLYWASPPRGCLKDAPLGGSIRYLYMQAMFQRKQYSLHTLIWAWHYDSDPPMINHINEDKLDNRIENLEASNPRHNTRHSAKGKRDLPTCIYRNGNGYVARLSTGGRKNYKRYNSPTVPTVEEAITELTKLEEKYLGHARRSPTA